MIRSFFSHAFAALKVVSSAIIDSVVNIVCMVIHAVPSLVALALTRLELPKVWAFRCIGRLKRTYRESWLTSGQSLHYRRWIYC